MWLEGGNSKGNILVLERYLLGFFSRTGGSIDNVNGKEYGWGEEQEETHHVRVECWCFRMCSPCSGSGCLLL